MTATFLSSETPDYTLLLRLRDKRDLTDIAIRKLNEWPQGDFIGNSTVSSKEAFFVYLSDFRNRVESGKVDERENIKYYTSVIKSFMFWSEQKIVLPERGNIWSKIISVNTLMWAADAIGIRRAIGASYFIACQLSSEFYTWFYELEGQAESLIAFGLNMHLPSSAAYRRDYTGKFRFSCF